MARTIENSISFIAGIYVAIYKKIILLQYVLLL